MRIYNGMNSQLELPLGNGEKISVGPQSISQDFLPSTNFLGMLVTNFDYNEIALVVNGQMEINLCSSVSACNGFVVYSVSDAVARFTKKPETEKTENPALANEENAKKQDEEVKELKKSKKKTEEKVAPENPSNS